MSLNDTQIQLLQNLYNDESLGLTTEKKLYDYLKEGNRMCKPMYCDDEM